MWRRVAALLAPLDADRRYVVDALVVKPDSNADSLAYATVALVYLTQDDQS